MPSFADGVQDEILTNLAKVADLKVISRTSVVQYKAAAARNLREIGQALGVAHVLEGSVQRVANKVRVNAQLIDARNDAASLGTNLRLAIWPTCSQSKAKSPKRSLEQLQAHLSANEKAEWQSQSRTIPSPTIFIFARDNWMTMSNDPDAKGSLLQGISLLEEAVRRDPKFLRAYCLMCETHLDLYWDGFDHTEQRRELARVALQKAEEIQPDAGEVHWMKGLYAYHGFRDYDRALGRTETGQATSA